MDYDDVPDNIIVGDTHISHVLFSFTCPCYECEGDSVGMNDQIIYIDFDFEIFHKDIGK
jgi:hypothetical protein